MLIITVEKMIFRKILKEIMWIMPILEYIWIYEYKDLVDD